MWKKIIFPFQQDSETTPLLHQEGHKSQKSSEIVISTRQSKSSGPSADQTQLVPFLSAGNSKQRNEFGDGLLRTPNSSDVEGASGHWSRGPPCVTHASSPSSSSSENEYLIGNGRVDLRDGGLNDDNRVKDLQNKVITKPSILPKPKIHMKVRHFSLHDFYSPKFYFIKSSSCFHSC